MNSFVEFRLLLHHLVVGIERPGALRRVETVDCHQALRDFEERKSCLHSSPAIGSEARRSFVARFGTLIFLLLAFLSTPPCPVHPRTRYEPGRMILRN